MKKYILIFIGVFTLTLSANAQKGFENILLADPSDASKLLQGYFNPAVKGFIYGMNNGWYHTAKVHKTLGFDISIVGNLSITPTEDKVFDISGLNSITSTATTAPTFAGNNTETPMVVTRTITVNGTPREVSANFEMLGGLQDKLSLGGLPTPAVQANLGLPFETELMVRYLPETTFKDSNINMMGIGIKKEITSWFGPIDKLPLHISLMAAYSALDVNYDLKDINTSVFQMSNAGADLQIKAYTVQAIASLNFPFISAYGGIGYSSGTSTFKMKGTYKGTYQTGLPAPNHEISETLTPPSNMEFDASGMKTTLGARISLLFFKIFADYTFQEYNTVSVGVAFSFR
ncbi:MAG: hypothetical protein P8K77_06455 [Polaribacter sp.]|nr:hypothetical protein [Polaribacter sp.]